MFGKDNRKDRVELDVNTKRNPPEKYYLNAQTNLKMHVEAFYPLKITYRENSFPNFFYLQKT